MLKQWSLSIALVVALFTSSACRADEIAIQQDANGVSYVTGGIGSEEVEALESFKKQFNLYFLFSEGKIGRLVDDVNISILDAKKQTVFSLEHAAPRLLLSLPTGRYTVIASYQGNSQRYTLNANAKKHQRVILNWKNTTLDEDSREENRQDEITPDEIKNDTRAAVDSAS
jgi:hypothetical protein